MDRPFIEAAESANKLILGGATIFQKFTCQHCGSRQTMPTPNAFFYTGKCEECEEITDIFSRGCGYVLVRAFNNPEDLANELGAIMLDLQTKRGTAC